jgi:hypothetical protein
MIECTPSELYETDEGHFLLLSQDDSYIKTIKDDELFPKLSTIESKISSMSARNYPQDVVLEGYILHKPERTEIALEDGTIVPGTYTTIGDTTGQIKLQEFYGLTLNKLSVGDRIKVIGATPFYGFQGYQGDELVLQMTNFGSIVKVATESASKMDKVNPSKDISTESGTLRLNRKQAKGGIEVILDKLEFFKDYTEAHIAILNDNVDDELQLSESDSRASQNNKYFALTNVRPWGNWPAFLKPNIPPNSNYSLGIIKFEPLDSTKHNAKFQFKIKRKPLHNSYDFNFDVSIAKINQT